MRRLFNRLRRNVCAMGWRTYLTKHAAPPPKAQYYLQAVMVLHSVGKTYSNHQSKVTFARTSIFEQPKTQIRPGSRVFRIRCSLTHPSALWQGRSIRPSGDKLGATAESLKVVSCPYSAGLATGVWGTSCANSPADSFVSDPTGNQKWYLRLIPAWELLGLDLIICDTRLHANA